ncbi:MAG: DNA polymerase III subunit gamma/tau, partial [Candidatus Eremiobacteraeota bacterium]|nr:DNA polymerase III subunit gamma/tau [Candidatus Eremiobacteraeota bacterium]
MVVKRDRMASVSLFRKWRSQRFQDLVGQESVVRTLQNVLLSDSPARAYLFCGPRGTGKTSSARIFAKALNCENGPGLEPCNECDQCRAIASGSSLDVFEIDAASHTQVDKIRDFIVDKVHFAPVTARVKVYIIDEVHKLSASSFNALLKTLEEPPSHVVFILATTHPHELPPTILSRCQRYDFRPLSVAEIRARLAYIADSEGVELVPEAGDQLARAADGSLRDALVLFEQAVTFCGERVELEPVLELLGTVGYQVMERLVMALRSREAGSLLLLLHELNAQGRDLKRLASAFLEHLRLVMLVKVKAPDSTFEQMAAEERESLERLAQAVSLVDLMHWIRAGMELSAEVREGRQAKLLWELTLVRLATPSAEPGMKGLEARIVALEERLAGQKVEAA